MHQRPIGDAGTRYRPEIELLLCCARTDVRASEAERVRALVGHEMDWSQLIKSARHHGVMPLLHQNLERICADRLPNRLLAVLRHQCGENAQRNLSLFTELISVLDLLQAHGIQAITFKGPTLAVLAYGDLSRRTFEDLDILIHPRDLQLTQEALTSHGYELRRELNWQMDFGNPDNDVNIDLHHKLTPPEFPVPFRFDSLWTRVNELPINGSTVSTLSSEDLLLILCVHITKDVWRSHTYEWGSRLLKLKQACDVAELLRSHQNMDFELVFREARELGAERMLIFGLCFASNLLGVALKDEVTQKVQTAPRLSVLAAEAGVELLHGTGDDRHPSLFSGARFHSQVRERGRDKVFVYYMLCRGYLAHQIHLFKKHSTRFLKYLQSQIAASTR